MQDRKKPWVAPRLQKLEPTPELIEIFKKRLEEHRRAPDTPVRRVG